MVPFAEEVPFMDNPLMAAFMKNVVGMPYTLTPGNQYVLFKIPLSSSTFLTAPLRDGFETYGTIELDSIGRVDPEAAMKYKLNYDENPESYVKFSAPICFEDAFPDVCTPLFRSGSEVFLNITNDSWSKTPSSEYQHFIVASFLAIEYRTTLVRCANAGYSVVVAPNGKILNDMDVFTEDAIGCSVPIYERKATVFSILGDWFAYLVFTFMALYFAVKCVIFNFKRIRQSPAIQKLAKSILKDDEIQEEEEAESEDEEQEILESEDTAKTETIDTGWQPLFIPEYTPKVTLTKPIESTETRPKRKRTQAENTGKTKTAARKTQVKKTQDKKVQVKKTQDKKTQVKKTHVKKASEEKVTRRKANTAASTAKKPTASKTTVRKITAEKTTASRTSTRKTQAKSNTRGRKRENKK